MKKGKLVGEDWAIFNCHIHTFTRKNVPKYIARIQLGYILGTVVSWFEEYKFFLKFVVWLVSIIQPKKLDTVMRLARFVNTGKLDSQPEVFQKIQTQYPGGTKFIILPMNMDHWERLVIPRRKLISNMKIYLNSLIK